MKAERGICLKKKERENFDRRYRDEEREESKRMEGWVSGRGNKRGSKLWPGPGVANGRAPAGSSREFEQAVTSLGASRRHPFHPRSMTRPCASRSVSRPFAPLLHSPPFYPLELNRVLVPVLKGAAAVSATQQPCLYLASTHHLALSSLRGSSISVSLCLSPPLSFPFPILPLSAHPLAWLIVVSLLLFLLLHLFLSCPGLCPLPFPSLGDINNAIAQASNFRADGSNNV